MIENNKKNTNKKNNSNNKKNNNIKNNNSDKNTNIYESKERDIGLDVTGIDDIDVFDDGKDDIPEIKEINISKRIDKRDKDIVVNCRRVLKSKHKEEKETTIISDIQKNILLWTILSILFIILIVAIVATNTGGTNEKDTKDTNKTEITTEELTTEELTTEEDEKQLKAEEADSPITKLISNYLKAERIDVSMEEVTKYVDNSDKISIEKYELLKKYIEEYQNVTCYKLSSIDENVFIVVATYGCKFFNIETAAPGCETFVVVYNDGEYLVHNLTVQESIDTYISSDVDVSLINQINKEINDSLKSAVASDEELANLIAVLSSSDSENTSE